MFLHSFMYSFNKQFFQRLLWIRHCAWKERISGIRNNIYVCVSSDKITGEVLNRPTLWVSKDWVIDKSKTLLIIYQRDKCFTYCWHKKPVTAILRYQAVQIYKKFNFLLPTNGNAAILIALSTSVNHLLELYVKSILRKLCFVW